MCVMVYDKFFSLQEEFWGWKSLIWGEIVDLVILQHRQLMRETKRKNNKEIVSPTGEQ